MKQLFCGFLFILASFAVKAQSPVKHDSATIIFKNVSKDTMIRVQAIIKNQWMFTNNLMPNEEYSHKICSDSTIKGQLVDIYRFTIALPRDGKASISPTDYFDQVSKMDITTGTYIYYIGIDPNEGGSLDIKLKKIK